MNIASKTPTSIQSSGDAQNAKNNTCPATVTQYGTEFVPGNYGHSHTGVYGILEDALLRTKVREESSKQKSLSAKLLVESAILETEPKEHVPNPANLVKMIHRARSHAL